MERSHNGYCKSLLNSDPLRGLVGSTPTLSARFSVPSLSAIVLVVADVSEY